MASCRFSVLDRPRSYLLGRPSTTVASGDVGADGEAEGLRATVGLEP